MNDLMALAERIAGQAAGDEQIEVYVARGHHTEVKVFGGDIESLSSADSHGVGVRVIVGQRQGFAYAATLEDDIVHETLQEARDNATFGTPDEHLGLPDPDAVAPAHLDVYRPEMSSVHADRKVELALEVERATRAADPRVRGVDAAAYGDTISEVAIASSAGIRAASQRTVCSVVADAIAGEGSETQTGYGYSVARHPDDLDVAKAAREAAERATRLLGARKPASCQLTVVFDPRVTASFLGVLSRALSGEAVLKGRSILARHEGQEVAAPAVTLVDDPTDPGAYGASPFDAEGLASRRNVLIEGGVLRGFLHNAYTGRRSGRASNAAAVRGGFKSTPGVGSRALTLRPGRRSPEEIIADAGEGLLVQSVTGLHSGANPVSGDFSVGVEGLMIRGGALAEPVREATVASTLQRMLRSVVAVGSDLEWLPGGAAGVTIAIGDVTLSGT